MGNWEDAFFAARVRSIMKAIVLDAGCHATLSGAADATSGYPIVTIGGGSRLRIRAERRGNPGLFRLVLFVDESVYLASDPYYNDKGDYEHVLAVSPDMPAIHGVRAKAVEWVRQTVAPLNAVIGTQGEGSGTPEAPPKRGSAGKRSKPNGFATEESAVVALGGLASAVGDAGTCWLERVSGNTVYLGIQMGERDYSVLLGFLSPWTYDAFVCSDDWEGACCDGLYDTSPEDAEDMGAAVVAVIDAAEKNVK